MSFEQLFEEIRQNTTKMSATLDGVKSDTGRTLELTEQQAALTSSAAKNIETESARDQADTIPEAPTGMLGGGAVINILKDIRNSIQEVSKGENGGGGLLDLAKKFLPSGGAAAAKQTGGFVYPSPAKAFQKGGGVFKVPGNSTGDNHNMLLPQGSFVLNRNASQTLEAQSGGMIPPPLTPLGFQEGDMVPVRTESQEMIFGPNSFSSLIPILNDLVPRFQSGGVVETSHADTGKGYQPAGTTDSSGRPVVLSKNAAEAFAKAMLESEGSVKGSDVASSQRSKAKNSSLPGAHPNSSHLYGEGLDASGSTAQWFKSNPNLGFSYGYSHGPGSIHFNWKGSTQSEDDQYTIPSSGSPVKPGPSPTGSIGKTSGGGSSSSGGSGIFNLPKNYAETERLQFEAAGGWTPYSAPSSTDPQEAQRLETMDPLKKNKEGGFKKHNDFNHEFFPGFTSDVHSSDNSQYAKDQIKLDQFLNPAITGNIIGNITNILSGGSFGALALLGGGLNSVLATNNDGESPLGNMFDGIKGGVDSMFGTNFLGKKDEDSGNRSDGGGDSPSMPSLATGGDAKDKGILDMVASVEAAKGDPYGGFNTSAGTTPGRATEKTIQWLANNAQGAIGRYQHMPQFLTDRARAAGIPLDTKFTPEVQDKLTIHFLKGEGGGMYDKWKSGKVNDGTMADELSRIWRGLPHSSGGTYPDQYAGRNKAHMSREVMMKKMKEIKGMDTSKKQSDKKQLGGVISPFGGGKGLEPVKVESGELIFSPGSYGPEIPQLNSSVPRFQSGGTVGGNVNNLFEGNNHTQYKQLGGSVKNTSNNLFEGNHTQYKQLGGSVKNTSNNLFEGNHTQYKQLGGNVRSSNPKIDNTNIQNFVANRFSTANQTHNAMSQQQPQPIVVPVPMGGQQEASNVSDGFGGGAPIPSLTSAPSNHIVSSLMMSSYSLMQRIG